MSNADIYETNVHPDHTDVEVKKYMKKQMSTRVVTPPTAAARVAVSNLGTSNALLIFSSNSIV